VGIFTGIIIYAIIMYTFDMMMFYFADCESLGPFDAVFLLDDKQNYSNITGVLFFEEFEFESMKNYLLQKTETVHKARSKLSKRFGIYWFEKMSAEEWNEKKSNVFVLDDNVRS
jgi:hypothetical protein